MFGVELYVKGTTFSMLWEEKTWEIVIGGPCVYVGRYNLGRKKCTLMSQ